MTREFVLYSRLGRTDSSFRNLHDAGRLDIVYEGVVASLFLSHAIRKDVVFNALLSGPPTPPLNLRIEGATLHDVRTDQETWERILRKVLGGHTHPGITTDKMSFEALLKIKAKAPRTAIYVLEEKGKNISKIELSENAVFVLGDHIGLPKTVENFALRYAEKISLGKRPYLAASCITILNYLMDNKAYR
ncbi:MAG TPA: tRNA (pseudouridine(54)-N(1))-methyltransferase TrmY [candidate division Zixibacteria bacterium]|nr:tRNA (pseudouridine(54)-N(1))-methyltransferase TrmY [candidate division Zixibacteria bacterium]